MINALRETVKSLVPKAGLNKLSKLRTVHRCRRLLQELRRDIAVCSDGEKYITYLVMQGMTNRFKAHIMAAHFAEKLDRKLVPVWYKTPECHAEFSDLFSNAPAAWSYSTQTVVCYDIDKDQMSPPLESLRKNVSDLLILDLDWQYTPMNNLIDRIGGTDNFAALFTQTLHTRPDIQERVEQTISSWGRPMIGVQLRRGDFVKFGMSVPIETYITATENALWTRPDMGIYLASDASRTELKPFLDHFGERCVFTESQGRDNEDGIRDAMYDLLLLSRCQYLILTKISGFGHMAAQIGALPYEWVE